METEGIISNPVTQDIRLKGHQSIRLAADGFSILVSDASYKPILLKHFYYEAHVPYSSLPGECARILEEMELLDFEGETVIILDNGPFVAVPESFLNEENDRILLEKAATVEAGDRVEHRFILDRHLFLIYACSPSLDTLVEQIKGKVRIIHCAECMNSLADQVQASDHQRGFLLAEVQNRTLHLLVIREDQIILLNRFALREPSDFIYHTLNVMKQLDLDRSTIPVYLSGIVHPDHELYGLLGKYIRNVKTTPYYLEELQKAEVLRSMILSEGSKCV
jgi:hypothetical protein